MSEPFIGQIMAVPYTYAPYTWAFCWGQQISAQQNQVLFALIGTMFGGDTTNFKVPDLRGRVVLGAGSNPGIAGLPSTIQVAQNGGAAQQALSPAQVPLQAHTHNAVFIGTGGGGSGPPTASGTVSLPVSGTLSGSVSVTGSFDATSNNAMQPAPQPNWTIGDANGMPIYADPAGGTNVAMAQITSTGTFSGSASGATASGSVTLPVTGASGITGGTVTVAPATAPASAAVSTISPYLVLNNIIALQGIFPSRD